MLHPLESTFRLVHRHKVEAFKGIPGPDPILPFGTALDFVRRGKMRKMPWEVCAGYGHRYGGMTLIWLGGKPALVLNDPKLIGKVLVDDWQSYYKDSPHKALLPVITRNSAFLANPPEWQAIRDDEPFAMKGFKEWLPSQIAPMREVLSAHLDDWSSLLDMVDLVDDIQRATFDAFTVATCGVRMGGEAYEDFLTMAKVGSQRMTSLLPISYYPHTEGFETAHDRWFARFDTLVQHALQKPDTNRTDLLAELIRRDEAQRHVTPDARPAHQNVTVGTALRDGVANIAYGGVFSVTSAITSALYLLAANPSALNRLVEELKQETPSGGGDEGALLSSDNYLDCVVRETLRYYCPVPLYYRNVSQKSPANLGGREIPEDTMIWITPWLIHRSSEHWNDGNTFRPERWEEEKHQADKDERGSEWFFPFGRGPRICVSVPFSMMYMKLALATILTRARVSIDTKQPYKQDFFFGVMLPRGLKAQVQPLDR